MENIRERKGQNGVTYQVYLVKNGKQISKSFPVKKYGSKKTALEYAKAYRNRLMLDDIVVDKDDDIEDVFEMALDVFPKTVETHRKWEISFKKYILPYCKGKFKDIKSADVQLTLNSMIETASDDTISRVFSVWKLLYKAAIMKDIVHVDQTVKVIKPKSDLVRKPKDQVLDEDSYLKTLETLMSASDDYKTLGYALQVLYYTGARPNEVYALMAEDVDRVNKTISINKSIGTNSTNKGVVKRTKNASSIRTIPYNPKLDEIWDVLPEHGYLFKRADGSFIDGNYASYVLKRVSGGKVRAYTLRHQFSTDLLNGGVDLRTIQQLMGHTSSTMTLEYARSDEQKMREAVANK